MSQAFMREKDEEWLGEVSPNPDALARYLTRANNGVRVYEIKRYKSPAHSNKEIHEMSNGSSYILDMDNRWSMV
jgi:copper(I)-binding protein